MTTTVCIVGGGPAGMVLALLLVRSGVEVTVLEKNHDFEREFRGEVLQPRFMRAMEKVELLELIQSVAHEKFQDLRVFHQGQERVKIRLQAIDPKFPYVTWMTQPSLLKALYDEASKYPNFHMHFGARVSELVEEGGRVAGVRYGTEGNTLLAKVVVAADGRFSKLRQLKGAEFEYASHDFDVLWFEMERPDEYTHGADFFLSSKVNALILPKHPNKIQCGILVQPGKVKEQVKQGPQWIATSLKRLHPMFESFADALVDFDCFTVLEAKIEMLRRWSYPGLLFIGDAAHTCSPAGAIGVTIAVETAICAAHVIQDSANDGHFLESDLSEVRRIRQDQVRTVHSTQRRGVFFLAGNPVTRRIVPILLPVAVSTGIAPRILSRLLSGNR